MTKSFDELAKYHSLNLMKWDEDFYASENTQLAKAFYEAGQQSKQAEVDGLQLKLSEDSRVLHNVIDIERRKCEELQERIDVLSKKLNEMAHIFLDDLDEILKGNTNEH